MNISRRDLLKCGVGAAALAAAPERLRAATGRGGKIPIGVVLRNDCRADVPGSIRALAKMGFEGIEFPAGCFGRSAQDMRKLLDENGLRCCGSHTPLNALLADALEKTIAFNKVLGSPYLIVPILPSDRMASVRSLVDTAKLFSDLAVKLAPLRMRVGFHAHPIDFKPVEGQIPWEVIFDNASPDVLMELDIANCLTGGGDPIRILRKYPGRSATIHLKEYGDRPDVNIGEGRVDWKPIFQLCESTGGTQWYIVETRALPSVPASQRCLENLRKMGK